jgi:hypothetical protein
LPGLDSYFLNVGREKFREDLGSSSDIILSRFHLGCAGLEFEQVLWFKAMNERDNRICCIVQSGKNISGI